MMIKVIHEHEEEWDYKGYINFPIRKGPYAQHDWNATFITKINYISTLIHKSSIRGGANSIRGNDTMINFIKDIYGCGKDDNIILNRYRLEVDNLIHEDSIYCYSNRVNENPLFIPNKPVYGESEIVMVDGEEETTTPLISETFFRLSTDVDEERVSEYKKSLIGKINIKNYGKED